MNKVAKPLKIFISYGHEIDVKDDNGNLIYPEPNNESVVRIIKTFLESRGHEVWLDKERIKPGSEWRKSIYEGVEWSDVALICLSRKAMKPNGVCRDEISIALGVRGGNMFPIKLEALEDSEYPAYLLNRQLFTRFMDWRLHWTENSIDEAWLDQNLEELAKALEEKDVWLYGVEMVELKNILKPWNMSSRLKSLDRETQCLFNGQTNPKEEVTVHKFCGRESLFQMFDGKIAQSGQAVRIKAERVLWLKKGPGFGKSRFAAELLYRYYYVISATYFIEYNQKETLDPHTFIKSVAYQLAQANSSYREKLLSYLKENQDKIDLQTGDPQTLFKLLVVDLLSDEIDGGRATQWILVDALDEATENNRNEIASLISQNLDRLPPWICFFITSRDKDSAVNRNFAQFTPLDFPEEENENDVRDYIINEFEGMNITVSEDMVNILQEKSEGTFLYPRMVIEDLNKKTFSFDDIHDLSKGVIGYIHKQFDRLFSKDLESYENNVRPMLGFILTSCEPISRAVLKYCLGISRDSELDKRLKALGTFFIQSGSTDEDIVVPFHKSVIDYCFDKDCSEDYYVYPDEAKEDFANRGLELYKSGALQWTTRTDEEPDIVQRYFLNWLPSHLMNTNMKEEAADVLSDFAFLMKRLRFGNVERVLQDYILFRDALKGVSKNGDAYFDVICSNVHFLRRNCEDNPAYMIMLQIGAEVADDCPVTQAAERWLNPKEGDSPCNWFWLNKVKRPKEYQPSPCKLVIENAGNQVMLLSNGDVLSWGGDNNLRIFDLQTGVCKATLKGHADKINGAIELSSGDILSSSLDNSLRRWSLDGKCQMVMEGHTDSILSCYIFPSGEIISCSNDQTLRLWSLDGTCKAIMKGHTDKILGSCILHSCDILTWGKDQTLRLWSPDGTCKAVMEGHTDWINNAVELQSGDILSWCNYYNHENDQTLRLWSPDGTCKAVMCEHNCTINGIIELRSGDILSWGLSDAMHLWSSKGTCKMVLDGHKCLVNGAIELRSGDILSWSMGDGMRLWSSDGISKAFFDKFKYYVNDVIELHTGDMLSWCRENIDNNTLRLWSPNGECKATFKGHTGGINKAIELRSGHILSWCRNYNNDDFTLRHWSPDGTCISVLEGHTNYICGARELSSGDILSWSMDNTLRLWSPNISYKTVQDGHKNAIRGTIELSSGNVLSWGNDTTLRLWSPDRKCKTIFRGHKWMISNAIELRSGNILSWDDDDSTLRLWSPDGICKAILEGHRSYIRGVHELCSGNILSWSDDNTLRLWSPDGICKAVLEGHTDSIHNILELNSGDFLSWCRDSSKDYTVRLWMPDGTCKAVLNKYSDITEISTAFYSDNDHSQDWYPLRIMFPDWTSKDFLEGFTDEVEGAIELHSGNILLWRQKYRFDYTMSIWSPDGMCKTILKGHIDTIKGCIELRSGDFLSWSWDNTLRLWEPDGTCKAVLEGHTGYINGAIELHSGDILSWSCDCTMRLWSSDGTCKDVINSKNPQFDSYYAMFCKERVHEEFYVKQTNWGIELQHDFKPIVRWNNVFCKSRFIGAGRLCVWYGNNLDFLQLNYGNHMSVSFDQAHQLLAGEIDESQLVTYVPEPKGTEDSKTESE